MLGFLLVDEQHFAVDEQDAARSLTADSLPVLVAALAVLEALDEMATASVEAALRSALVDGLGIKPKNAFGPVRVAVTGRRVSPPLFESIELLGRDRTLGRLRAAVQRAGSQ